MLFYIFEREIFLASFGQLTAEVWKLSDMFRGRLINQSGIAWRWKLRKLLFILFILFLFCWWQSDHTCKNVVKPYCIMYLLISVIWHSMMRSDKLINYYLISLALPPNTKGVLRMIRITISHMITEHNVDQLKGFWLNHDHWVQVIINQAGFQRKVHLCLSKV